MRLKSLLFGIIMAFGIFGIIEAAPKITQNYIDDILNEALDKLGEIKEGYGPDNEYIVVLKNGEVVELIKGGSAAIYDKNGVRIYTILSDGREIIGKNGENVLPRSRSMAEMYPNAADLIATELPKGNVKIDKEVAVAPAPMSNPLPEEIPLESPQEMPMDNMAQGNVAPAPALEGGFMNVPLVPMAPMTQDTPSAQEPMPQDNYAQDNYAPTPAPAPAPYDNTNAYGAPTGYYVQVAAYANPNNPNRAELNAIAQFDYIIEKAVDNNTGYELRRYLIGPYPSRDAMSGDMPRIREIINYLHHGQTSAPYIRNLR